MSGRHAFRAVCCGKGTLLFRNSQALAGGFRLLFPEERQGCRRVVPCVPRRGSFEKTSPATCSGNQSCITFAAGKIRGPYEKKSCRAGFRNARARHSRVRHDGDFALCRRRLACEHSDCRASDFRLCARRVRRGPGADFRASASAQADFADIGMPDDRGQSVRCGCARLRRADVGALRFGTASRSLFRRGLDRCREAGRRGKRRRGRVDHDRRA